MSESGLIIERRLRRLVGTDAVIDTDDAGIPRVAPRAVEACALVLRTARTEGWKVRLSGGGRWSSTETAADLTLSASALTRVVEIKPADLVATVEAGVEWENLRRQLADEGVWLPLDPPGDRRTLGSIAATATAGPLRTGFGTVRDQLLGVTLVTPEGRVVHAGSRMVKNVAGFELTKLVTGSFGGFGFITTLHLRLRAVPRADVTLVARGDRDRLIQDARAVLQSGLVPAALEILSPAATGEDAWTLAVRLVGSNPAVRAEGDAVKGTCSCALPALPTGEASEFWHHAVGRVTDYPATLRLGALVTSLDEAADLIAHHLGDDAYLAISVGAGAMRWSGDAPDDRIRLLRHAAAQREMPITIERGPRALLRRLGHFGEYREGVSRLVGGLRSTFDPTGVLDIPLTVAPGDGGG